MITYFITTIVTLFSLINPLSAIPVFLTLTQDCDKLWIKKQIKNTSINIFVISVVSFFLGSYILLFFGISIDALKLAGGIIIGRSGFQLLNAKHKKDIGKKLKVESKQREDISFVPLAMPLLAGPGSISFLINESIKINYNAQKLILVLLIITSISVLIFVVFTLAPKILKIMGQAGLNALSKIMGFLVLAIGIQLILSSICALISKV